MSNLLDEVFELKSLINTQKQNLKRIKRIKLEVDLVLDSYESNLKLIEEQYELIKEKTKKEIG